MKITIDKLSVKIAENLLSEKASKILPIVQLQQYNSSFVNEGQPSRKWEPLKPIGSYRDGGKPLRNTGALKAAANISTSLKQTGNALWESEIVNSLPYALYQQYGFSTNGPNFIPLTQKAARTHVKGNDPKTEGLKLNVDYIVAWGGVTVPARPMIDYSDPINIEKFKKNIEKALMS